MNIRILSPVILLVSRVPVWIIKIAVALLILAHTAYLVIGVFEGYLGANPIETLTHVTGEWGLYLLLGTLALTPLRRLFHWNRLARYRRFLGLCSFYYVFSHLMIFLVFDHSFDLASIFEDIIERPYITVGAGSFLILLLLALTSFKWMQRKMAKRWVRLHQMVYVAGILSVIHYWWLVKADISQPLLYAAILVLLLGVRLHFFIKKKRV